jgi:DNA adenine methylase
MLKGTVKSTDVERAWALWYSFNLTYANKLGAGLKSSVHPNTHIPTLMKNKKLIWTEQLAKRIENTNIEAKPAIEVLKSYNEEYVFHFIDPPYLNADQGHYKGFTEDDFVELLEVVKTLKGTFMLTNYPSVVLKDYRDSNAWYLKSFGFNNKVNSKHEKRKGKTEWVITNYNPDTQKGQLGIKY